MPLTVQTKALLIFIGAAVIGYLIYNQYNQSSSPVENMTDIGELSIPSDDDTRVMPQTDYAPPESDWTQRKFNGRNKARNGTYKHSSYSEGARGNLGASDWTTYFNENNDVIGPGQVSANDKFKPFDETGGNFATFKSDGMNKCGSNQNCEPEDLFDVDKYLPQETNNDWFDVPPEPISIKNRHLINTTKPIGIDTIGSSHKNASYDLRGAPANPKFVVSPWLQSSIEPDTSLKPLF